MADSGALRAILLGLARGQAGKAFQRREDEALAAEKSEKEQAAINRIREALALQGLDVGPSEDQNAFLTQVAQLIRQRDREAQKRERQEKAGERRGKQTKRRREAVGGRRRANIGRFQELIESGDIPASQRGLARGRGRLRGEERTDLRQRFKAALESGEITSQKRLSGERALKEEATRARIGASNRSNRPRPPKPPRPRGSGFGAKDFVNEIDAEFQGLMSGDIAFLGDFQPSSPENVMTEAREEAIRRISLRIFGVDPFEVGPDGQPLIDFKSEVDLFNLLEDSLSAVSAVPGNVELPADIAPTG